MEVLKRSYAGIQSFSLDAMLLDLRIVFLEGEITSESINSVVKQLLFLESVDNQMPIKLIINSPGGSVSAGLLLYDQLKGMCTTVDIFCTEMAASMAAIILASGKREHRFALKHSQIIIHEPLISASNRLSGSMSNIVKSVEGLIKTKNIMLELLATDTGHSVKEMEEAISYDNVMTAEEALKFGIVDGIVDRI